MWDEVIVGQGLAGTSLAWALRWRGHKVMIIDRQASTTSSRVAAGLMTPITGQRLAKSWRWNLFWQTASNFYARVEAETKEPFFHPTRLVRLLADDREAEFLRKRLPVEFNGLAFQPDPLVDSRWFVSSHGGFEMVQGGRLDVRAYLDASRHEFLRQECYLADDIVPERDVQLTDTGVELSRLGIKAQRIIFCQGIDALSNSWFDHVRFNPAKGQILTLRIDGLGESRIVHRGVWLMPIRSQGENLFRAGATYEWNRLDHETTTEGRDEICSRLKEFLRLPFEVVGHDAAVRPVLANFNPLIGLHPHHPQLGFFNGLGSKGSLQAPWLADHFAGYLAGQNDLDPEVDLQRLKGIAARDSR